MQNMLEDSQSEVVRSAGENVGDIYLYYGTGGGKTASSLGLALRSVGHGHSVTIIQFLKYWKKTGEYKITKKLKPEYNIKQFGRPGWLKTEDVKNSVTHGGITVKVRGIQKEDKDVAAKAIKYAEKLLEINPPDLLILDEVCLAAYLEIIDTTEVLELLDKVPEKTDVVLTGRYTPDKLIKRADFVNEVREVKAPYLYVFHKGIQY